MNFTDVRRTVAGFGDPLRRMAAAFRDDLRGVAAVEFAFIAPLMIVLFVGTIEVSSALAVNRKLSRVASTIGDLVTQEECYSDTTLTDIVEVADDIMYPFSNAMKIRLTGILVESGAGKVKWSRGYNTTPASSGSTYTVPAKIRINGNFLIAAKIETTFIPAVGWMSAPKAGQLAKDTSAIEMSEEMFLRPRIGNEITISSSC
ncbi:MAG: pilus assembly protein [Nitratireductor sp.]|nr:pilus assembly protein [Nitratireductor sp.]